MKKFELSKYNDFCDINRTIVEYEIPTSVNVTVINEVDFSAIEGIREKYEKSLRPPYTAFIVAALAESFKHYPFANANVDNRPFRRWIGGTRLVRYANIDIAIAAEKNISGDFPFAFADIIRNADKKSLREITNFLYKLRDATKDNNVQLKRFVWYITKMPKLFWHVALWMNKTSPAIWTRDRGASSLISSPSKYGVDMLMTSWSWPIGVSYGLVKKRPVVTEEKVEVRPTSFVTLSFDRRILSGAQAARFFKTFCSHLENPVKRE
ncbi:MAG: 2-oxo acid dehydrogenase subunit E2 [Bdellovibrionales bacterium]|nr:2-oxo acid dehydrogenase subunit E2 [Bdellovibrionales bacterium]